MTELQTGSSGPPQAGGPLSERLCLLCVHAHPDDESSKGAGTVARYHAEGVHTVLVCCTGGEEGDILNPAMERPEVRDDLARIRLEELARATAIIGYDEVSMLGYRDSGMPESPANQRPDCFARADMDEAVGRLVAQIRRTRPQVVITYNDDQQGYPHPDHLRVHEISVLAFEQAGDPRAHPGLGDPWQPVKLYYSVWSRARMMAIHEKFLELGLESPFDERWAKRPSQDDRITTRIDVGDYDEVRRQALLAHATQIDPTSPFWFGLPPEVARTVHPYEDYVLARSLVDSSLPEDDLFAGVRGSAMLGTAPGGAGAPALGEEAGLGPRRGVDTAPGGAGAPALGEEAGLGPRRGVDTAPGGAGAPALGEEAGQARPGGRHGAPLDSPLSERH